MIWRCGWYDLLATEVSTLRDLAVQLGYGNSVVAVYVVLLYKDSISTRDSFRISPTTFEVIGASMSYSTSYVWCGRQCTALNDVVSDWPNAVCPLPW